MRAFEPDLPDCFVGRGSGRGEVGAPRCDAQYPAPIRHDSVIRDLGAGVRVDLREVDVAVFDNGLRRRALRR